MKALLWLLALAAVAAMAYAIRRWRQRWLERQRAAEERFASFMAQARPAVAPAPAPVAVAAQPPAANLVPQRLLFEAATKAGEAGEPALAIQLYARLLSRFPESPFAAQARAAVEALKRKLVKT